MSRTPLSLAGFQVILIGRFWVIAEAIPRIFVVTLLQQGQSPTGLAYDLVLLRT